MSWASRRKTLYISIASIGTLVILGSLSYFILSTQPSCTDGAKNGGEKGIDCGGSCARICKEDTRQPVVLWSRSLKIAEGIYSAAAYIENGNGSAKAPAARYVFKLFDDRNLLVAERYGEVTIAAQQLVPIVEPNIATGNRIPARTFFEFVGDLSFEKEPSPSRLRVINEVLNEEAGTYEVTVVNDARTEALGVIVPAVLFDAQGNAQAVSRSTLARLKAGESEHITFTWPSALPPITRAEVTPYATF